MPGMHGAERLSLMRLRRRLPLPVFLLMLLFAAIGIGFACVCISDHPSQAAERAVSAVASAPAIVIMWAFFVAILGPRILCPTHGPMAATGRASPEELQRFRY